MSSKTSMRVRWLCVAAWPFCMGCGGDDTESTNDDITATDTDADSDTDTDSDTDADTDSDADSDGDSDGDADGDADTETEDEDAGPGLPEGEPLPEATPGTWEWVPFDDAKCRNGSKAGLSVRYNDGSSNLLIFLEGGGACFNFTTCMANPAAVAARNPGASGIFAFGNENNPFKDFNAVYIPYCTGDCHAGANPNGNIAGAGKQQFMGGENYRLFLASILATFPDPELIVISGYSAGSMGAAYNYNVTAETYAGTARVVAVADAAAVMREDYLTPCLQKIVVNAWNMDKYIPSDCDGCDPTTDDGSLHKIYQYVAEKHTEASLGLISALQDSTMRTFFGYGLSNCNVTIPSYPGTRYAEGLRDLRDFFNEISLKGGTYFFAGQQHGKLEFSDFYTTNVNGTSLVDWVNGVMEGGSTEHADPEL